MPSAEPDVSVFDDVRPSESAGFVDRGRQRLIVVWLGTLSTINVVSLSQKYWQKETIAPVW